jgi:hypothetical protein
MQESKAKELNFSNVDEVQENEIEELTAKA